MQPTKPEKLLQLVRSWSPLRCLSPPRPPLLQPVWEAVIVTKMETSGSLGGIGFGKLRSSKDATADSNLPCPGSLDGQPDGKVAPRPSSLPRPPYPRRSALSCWPLQGATHIQNTRGRVGAPAGRILLGGVKFYAGIGIGIAVVPVGAAPLLLTAAWTMARVILRFPVGVAGVIVGKQTLAFVATEAQSLEPEPEV